SMNVISTLADAPARVSSSVAWNSAFCLADNVNSPVFRYRTGDTPSTTCAPTAPAHTPMSRHPPAIHETFVLIDIDLSPCLTINQSRLRSIGRGPQTLETTHV